MQDTGIFLVNADGVLNLICITIAQVEVGIEVADCTLAITSESKRVGHEPCAILSEIECMFPGMRELGTSVRDDHLSDRHTPE
jgi:hypothetical protein